MKIDVSNTEYKKCVESVNQALGSFYERSRKASVITFGCQQNEADSEIIRGIAADMGYELSDDYTECDLIIVNTCAIRDHAERKALSFLGNFKAIKKKNPNLIVGICGCMCAEASVVELLKTQFHYVSFTLEPNMLYLIPSLVLKTICEQKRSFVIGEDAGDIVEGLPAVRKSGHKAWVSIMYGCNNFCSYCIVPYTRGRERSRDWRLIVEECERLASHGIKEITLLGQNVNSYKCEIDFAQLLEKIANIKGDFIVKFMTSHPKDVSDRLISVLKKYTPKIAPYFHLPLQSGSDRILSLMNRTYNIKRFLSVAEVLKEAIPGIALSTDVIVGFPTETNEDFEKTLSVLEKVRFDIVYGFIFSERTGTPAAEMHCRVPQNVKSERLSRLLSLQNTISYERNLTYLNKTVRVIADSKSDTDDNYTGRTDTNKLVHFKSEKNVSGEFVYVKIDKVGAFDLIGTAVCD